MINFISYIRNMVKQKSVSGGEKGSTLDEMVTKPVSGVLIDFYNTLVQQKLVNTVSRFNDMTESQLDDFGSKFFMPRYAGETASTMLRIKLNVRDDIFIGDDAVAVSDNNITFKPTKTGVILGSSFRVSNDGYSLFYVDIPIVATSKGDAANVSEKSINRLNNVSFDYVTVYNVLPVINGSKHETNEEYYNRLKYSINDRSLLTKAGVYANLKSYFPSARSTYVAGANSVYMNRDLASASVGSEELERMDFKGKIPNDTSIKHYAASYIFPPRPNTSIGGLWKGKSAKSAYTFPISITPVNTSYRLTGEEDAAFFGYDFNNEYDHVEYGGIYFNDYNKNTEIKTKNLIDMYDEMDSNYGKTVLTPNTDWVAGVNQRSSGDFGPMEKGINPIEALSFSDDTISLLGGTDYSLTVGKPTGKRVGLRSTGVISFPDAETNPTVRFNSNINVILAGTDGSTVDSFNGVGFGIMIYGDSYTSNKDNAVVYFTHSNRFGGSDVFININDFASNNATSAVPNPNSNSLINTNSLKELRFNLQKGASYEFEFTLKDNLELLLILTNTDGLQDPIKMSLPSNVLNAFNDPENGILSDSEQFYGTTAKITLNTNIENDPNIKWTVKDFKVVDTNPGRATSLYEFNVEDVSTDIRIDLRAYAKGAVNNVVSEGYTAYIWDRESVNDVTNSNFAKDTSNNALITMVGGWTRLEGVSNGDGLKLTSTGLLTETVKNIGRYIVNNGYGNKMYIMLVATGASSTPLKFNDNYSLDAQSVLKIDYIRLSATNDYKYHTRNKADLYTVTVSNENPSTVTTTTVDYNGSFARLSSDTGVLTPIGNITKVSVNSGTPNEAELTSSEYSIYAKDVDLIGSADEVYNLVINSSYSPNSITIEYSPYPDILAMQEYFDSGVGSGIYGDILVKHKRPVALSFSVQYSGTMDEYDVTSAIWGFVDNNNSNSLAVNDIIAFLYTQDGISSIDENITIGYTRSYDDGRPMSGSFSGTLYIRDVEFFSAGELTVSRSDYA